MKNKEYYLDDSKPQLVSKHYLVPFVLITSLFFLWGFARSILDVLNKHFQDALDLSKTESSLIQVMVYSAYFLMAVPAGLYINRKGYRSGVVFGLLIFALGALLFIPSEAIDSFPCFLISLFVIGCGLVFLETAANPYASNLGDPRTSASRLNMAQSFNGLGCVFGPAIVGSIIFSGQGSGSVAVPYAVMGIVVLCVAFVFTRVKLPEITSLEDPKADAHKGKSIMGLWRIPTFTFGLLALFCYEISEISINSFFINYVTDDGWMSAEMASYTLSFGALLLFMIARFVGSFIMKYVKAELVLLACGILTVLGSLLVVLDFGLLSKSGLFACYAFEAIMFPTIFALSLTGLGAYTKRASSFLMMTPIGGAVGTFLMAQVADATSMSSAFIVPMIGYGVVLLYSLYIVRK